MFLEVPSLLFAKIMVKYLVVLLNTQSVSFCHYSTFGKEQQSITPEVLNKAILYAMKENLMIQFVYPNFPISKEISNIVESIDHVKIASSISCEDASVVVANGTKDFLALDVKDKVSYVLRISREDIFQNIDSIINVLCNFPRLNIVLTDIESFSNDDFGRYQNVLARISETLVSCVQQKKLPQVNIITDRMILERMNNCNAGWESITLSPEGRFYICPAYYYAGFQPVGDLFKGLHIQNPQLYKLEYAPLCRNCDAFQCKRCIWLNQKLTKEVNTPSHEQCVISHLERNAARKFMEASRQAGYQFEYNEIKEIDYIDPFDVFERFEL